MLRCALLSISAVLFSGPGLLAEDPKAAEARPEKAPWQRRLQAEDGKRVEELQKQFDALREAGKYANALTPAREIFTIRTRGQGADHWETIYAKWQLLGQAIAATKRRHAQPAPLPVAQPAPPLLFLVQIAAFAHGHGDALPSEELDHARQERFWSDGYHELTLRMEKNPVSQGQRDYL